MKKSYFHYQVFIGLVSLEWLFDRSHYLRHAKDRAVELMEIWGKSDAYILLGNIAYTTRDGGKTWWKVEDTTGKGEWARMYQKCNK